MRTDPPCILQDVVSFGSAAQKRASLSDGEVCTSRMLKKTLKSHQHLLSTVLMSNIVNISYGGDNKWVNDGLTVSYLVKKQEQ